MENNLQIAIDGPVGSGKGTLAIALAKKLNAIHVYTGGMYRALALACIRAGIDAYNKDQVLDVLKKSNIGMKVSDDAETRIILNNEDVTDAIFYPEVTKIVPITSAYIEVREEMVKRQKEIVEGKRAVMEGRDVTSVVLPGADLKIFLTADVDIRAKRRLNQFREKKLDLTLDQVRQDIIERDDADTKRNVSPLQITDDSMTIDTSNDSIQDTVDKVLKELKTRNLLW